MGWEGGGGVGLFPPSDCPNESCVCVHTHLSVCVGIQRTRCPKRRNVSTSEWFSVSNCIDLPGLVTAWSATRELSDNLRDRVLELASTSAFESVFLQPPRAPCACITVPSLCSGGCGANRRR